MAGLRICMPNLGHVMERGRLVRWLVPEGARVARGDLVAVVESDKVTMEVEAPADGVLERHVVAPGTEVAVGGTLGLLAPVGGPAASSGIVNRPGPEASALRVGAMQPPPAVHETRPRYRVPAGRSPVAPAPSVPARGNDLPPATLVAFWRQMLRIRRFEETAIARSASGDLPGALHVCIGQEAVPVGVCAALRAEDTLASTHRGHGHALAKGASMRRMFAELFGRAAGLCGGKGGSQHVADLSVGMLGANGIVGASFGIAAGAALIAKRRGSGAVSVAFFGDGAASRGTLHEVLNIAALWRLPLVLVCEHNGYAQWVAARDNLAVERVAALAAPFGIPGETVDGNDVRAVFRATEAAVARARAGHGPSLIECRTQRYHGHTTSDMQVYRTREQVAALRRATDPLLHLGAELQRAGLLPPDARAAIEAEVEAEIAEALAFALASPPPGPDALLADVTAA
jgi:pyruvate dehydrogenase E1 component alpha subunit